MSSGDFEFNAPPPAGSSRPKPATAKKPSVSPKSNAPIKSAAKPHAPSAKPKANGSLSSAWLIGGVVAGLAIVGCTVGLLVFLLAGDDATPSAKDAKGQAKAGKKANDSKKQEVASAKEPKQPEVVTPPVAIPRTLAELRRQKEAAANEPAKADAKPEAEPEPIKPVVGTAEDKKPAKATPSEPKKKADKAPAKSTPKGPEPAWKIEIYKELQEVRKGIDDKNGAMNAVLDKLAENERKDALDALQFLTERYEKASPDEEEAVEKFAPHVVKLYQREMAMRSGVYAKQVKAKEAPDRLAAADRKKKHGELMSILNQKEKWTLAVPFDDLSSPEMGRAVEAAKKAEKAGIQSLTKDERGLLLRAGARDYFQRKLGEEK